MQYNESQLKAVRAAGGPVRVLAGPGSGKTAVLTGHVSHLIAEGTDPSAILVVTFTRAAAKEMQMRFLSAAGGLGAGVTFSTCHALFLRILRQECGYTERDILSGAERKNILKNLMHRAGVDTGEEMVRYLSGEISRLKNSGMKDPPEDPPPDGKQNPEDVLLVSAHLVWKIFREYQEILKRRRKIEFDDMPLLCLELFGTQPKVLERWQEIWREILVDEFQDINPVQYRLLCLLALPEDHLFVVGDEDQSIYAFRGATPQLILNFDSDHPGTQSILLDVNYRCPEEIIAPAMRLIGVNGMRLQKQIRGTGRTGGRILAAAAAGQREEAQYLAGDIRRRLSEGVRPEQMAVLFRSRSSAVYLQQALAAQMVPYRMKQKERDLYSHWITKDLFAYFSLAHDREDRDALLRILNRPERDLPREVFAAAGLSASERRCALSPEGAENLAKLTRDLDRIARFTPSAALQYIMDGIGYAQVLRNHAARWRIPEEELLEIPDLLFEAAGGFETFAQWQEAVRLSDRQRPQADAEEKEGVLLSTIHGVKGLEFDFVYLMDLNEGLLPIRTAVSAADIEEERRLCYVAMTRAKQELTMVTLDRYHAHVVRPSRFLAEAGLEISLQV